MYYQAVHNVGFNLSLTQTQKYLALLLLQAGGCRYVLRKKPPGKVLASAHAVDREYRVLNALMRTEVPIPMALCLCEDTTVIGTPFYVMEHVTVGSHTRLVTSASKASGHQIP
jgi:aminoglycoside phosphotransferase (APT) family kinase protein